MIDYFEVPKCQRLLHSPGLASVLSGSAPAAKARKVVLELLDLLGHPHPSDRFLGPFCDPSIASLFAESLWQHLPPSVRMGRRSKALANKLYNARPKERPLKGRILGPLGNYPNIEMDFRTARFVPLNGIPLLITSGEPDTDAYTELGYLSKTELLAASAVLLADTTPRFHLYFESGNYIVLSAEATEGLVSSEVPELFYELLGFNLKPHESREVFQPPTSTLTPIQYSFAPFAHVKEAKQLFGAIQPDDQLALRSCFMLQKASMLWLNQVFSEDAVANVFFALEGCLLLLQRKNGGSDSRIDLGLLTKLFRDSFDRGEELFDFIREAYDKRIEIVHPSPSSGANWQPFLMADDYYEYFDIVRELLNWILIDRKIAQ